MTIFLNLVLWYYAAPATVKTVQATPDPDPSPSNSSNGKFYETKLKLKLTPVVVFLSTFITSVFNKEQISEFY